MRYKQTELDRTVSDAFLTVGLIDAIDEALVYVKKKKLTETEQARFYNLISAAQEHYRKLLSRWPNVPVIQEDVKQTERSCKRLEKALQKYGTSQARH